jgi:Asp-tRNA(Asn)/Glu-tRNA(Gln) amidotransferase A subunit family amidase
VNSVVGLAPTQELVSRQGMMGAGLNTRVGPICRTVQDTAKVLDAYAGYDPKDELTVYSIGRKPQQPFASSANATRLDGLRIGVLREYMRPSLLTKADEESIALVNRAIASLRTLGATIVDPGAEGELFTSCIRRYAPELLNASFARQYPDLFPTGSTDQIASLLDLHANPARVAATLSLRTLNAGGFGPAGEGKYMINRYLRERGDANIKSNADLIAKATYYDEPKFRTPKRGRENTEQDMQYDMSKRMLRRFSMQQMILQCMAQQDLDALVYPTANLPPTKLGAPGGPQANGRAGVWSFLGAQGFPVITVPAGFTTEVYDWVRDPNAPEIPESAFVNPNGGGGGGGGNQRTEADRRIRLVGPTPAELPVGVDFVGRPFDEPLLLRIASAYEAATKHRQPPPEFGPLP